MERVADLVLQCRIGKCLGQLQHPHYRLGLTTHGLGDRVTTPAGADFPGVEVQANAIDNILHGDLPRRSLLRR